jgi:HEAT repeat protein
LIDLGPFGPWVLAFAVAMWLFLSVWLLGGRALHELRHMGVRIRGHRLVPRGPEQSPELHAERARGLVARLPAKVIERLAADAGLPKWLSGPFAVHTLAHSGAARFLGAAAGHRGMRGKWRRISALRILCSAGHADALGLLRTALVDADADVRGAAVTLLGGQERREAAELLVRALRERLHPASRVAARLDRFPLDVPDLIAPLVDDPDAALRFWGATLLARYGAHPGVAPALARGATDEDASVRKAAVESLGVVGGPEAETTAVRLLEDPVWFVRAHAARALGDLERADLAPRVLPLLADPQWWVRAAVKDALQAMGPAVTGAVAGWLAHPDRFARNGAAEVLQNLGVLAEIAGRRTRGEASADDLALLEGAEAAGGLVPEPGIVYRILPPVADRMRLVVGAVAVRGRGR